MSPATYSRTPPNNTRLPPYTSHGRALSALTPGCIVTAWESLPTENYVSTGVIQLNRNGPSRLQLQVTMCLRQAFPAQPHCLDGGNLIAHTTNKTRHHQHCRAWYEYTPIDPSPGTYWSVRTGSRWSVFGVLCPCGTYWGRRGVLGRDGCTEKYSETLNE